MKKQIRKFTKRTSPHKLTREENEPSLYQELMPQELAGISALHLVGSLVDRDNLKLRNRVLSPALFVAAMLHYVCAGLPSVLALIDRLKQGKIHGLAAAVFTPQAFYKRLHNLPHELSKGLFRPSSGRCEWRCCG